MAEPYIAPEEEFKYDCYVGMLKAQTDILRIFSCMLVGVIALLILMIIGVALRAPKQDPSCQHIAAKYQYILQHEALDVEPAAGGE